MLIDGTNILRQAYYNVPNVCSNISEEIPSQSDITNTNAVYGLINMLHRLTQDEKPDYMAVVMDKDLSNNNTENKLSFRYTLNDEYKNWKKSMPYELKRQYEVLNEILDSFGIYIIEKDEADSIDIIGTIANESSYKDIDKVIVTNDINLLQLISDTTSLILINTKGGCTKTEKYSAANVTNLYKITLDQLPCLKAITGNITDTLSGTDGIGEKTAEDILAQYGSLEKVYDELNNPDNNLSYRVCEKLLSNKDKIEKNEKIFKAHTDLDIEFDIEKAAIGATFISKVAELSGKIGLGQAVNSDTENEAPKKLSIAHEIIYVKTKADSENIFKMCKESDHVGIQLFDVDSSSQNGMGSDSNGQMFLQLEERTNAFVCILAMSEGKVHVLETGTDLTKEYILENIQALASGNDTEKNTLLCCFNGKSDYGKFVSEDMDKNQSAEEITRNIYDCKIAAYLINPLKNDYEIKDIASEYAGAAIPTWNELFGKSDITTVYNNNRHSCIEFFAKQAYILYVTQPVIEQTLLRFGMSDLFKNLEMPLSYVLYDMEREGILVKREELKAYGDALSGRISELEKAIYEQAGEVFNINSPKQLGEILFGKLGLPGGKKTKSGYSTAAEVLDKLAPDYPIVKDILEYRQLTKLKSTYADGLANYIGEDKKIHTNFNQTITATGRLSSTEPNLQNIPMRMELGRRIRKVFVPSEGCVFMDADYSQIELRVLAHMSDDKQLIEAYQMDEDIHRITASKVFHTPFEEVTDLQRRNAKAVNFGIVYGISSFGLSQDLSISNKEATAYIEEYFKTYPGIKKFLDKLVTDAKAKGYCESMFGRRRPVPELNSSNYMQRSFGERVAMNSPIQGTAADIIKYAMLHVYDALKAAKLKSKLILQIHDELLIETHIEETDKVQEILSREMQNACKLAVNLEIDLHSGSDWYEAK